MPWALDVPPGTSTKRTWAATVFFERSISVSTSRRGSGTGTTATFACPPCDPARVSAVNKVDFPENGTPTRPMSFMTRGYRKRSTQRPRPARPFGAARIDRSAHNYRRSVPVPPERPMPM